MAETPLCPRCQTPLKTPFAKSCECGWKSRVSKEDSRPSVEYFRCAYEGCKSNAPYRYRTKTGWANLCDSHYQMYTLAQAKQFTKERGLTTVDEMRAWIKSHSLGRGKMHGEFLKEFQRTNPKEPDEREAA